MDHNLEHRDTRYRAELFYDEKDEPDHSVIASLAFDLNIPADTGYLTKSIELALDSAGVPYETYRVSGCNNNIILPSGEDIIIQGLENQTLISVNSDNPEQSLADNIYGCLFCFKRYVSPFLKKEGIFSEKLDTLTEQLSDAYISDKFLKPRKSYLSGVSQEELDELSLDFLCLYKSTLSEEEKKTHSLTLRDIFSEQEKRKGALSFNLEDFLEKN